ncbi:MAG: ABC transporter ATP-binding protein [Oscillospiraceae bacterium]
MNSILKCTDLNKRYGKKQALSNLNINIESGKIVGLLGPNGSGKTTLIKTAAGILTPTSGNIEICGLPIGIASKKLVSYLPERTYLDENMSVINTINFFGDFYDNFDKEKAFDMLSRLGLSTTDKIKAMSKGTKEKLQLVLVMSRKAKLYLLDEPLGGVDPAARDFILETIISNYSQDGSVIISTHLIYDIEKYLDEVCFIKNGCQIMHTTVDDIRENKETSVDNLFREMFKC